LSGLLTPLGPIPFINCCVFKPLFPLMSLSEIVYCYVDVLWIGVRRGFVPTFILLWTLVLEFVLSY
jgi:hypothetical protein